MTGIEPEKRETTPARPTPRNRDQGDENEKIAERVTGLKRTRGSGCGWIEKGDLGSDSLIHLEAKSTSKDRIAIKQSWIDKAKRQAFDYGKEWFLQIAFMTRQAPEIPTLRWVVTSVDVWEMLYGDEGPDHEVGHSERSTFIIKQEDKLPGEPSLFRLKNVWYVLAPETWFAANLAAIEEGLKSRDDS